MNERGVGYVTDMLVFALLISFASLLLFEASPANLQAESTRYASSFAQSTLLALQHTTADEFGGFEYNINAFDLISFPMIDGSIRRNLRHKTLAQLLVEDALLNLRAETDGAELVLPRINQEMDERLRGFLKSALDKVFGGRFGYSLSARSKPIELQIARVHFETRVEDLSGIRDKICSESIAMSLPISQEELTWWIEEALGMGSLELEFGPDLVVDITLELWSR